MRARTRFRMQDERKPFAGVGVRRRRPRARNDDEISAKAALDRLPVVPFVYRFASPSDHGFEFVGGQSRKLIGKSAGALIKNPASFAPVIDDAAAFEADFIRPIS
ncbi:MAG: hypothetical protein FJX59_09710 [Alphaproteobacteria bacterium]|nr:hypothetical protein [Alphaproteobacteria bacterium]